MASIYVVAGLIDKEGNEYKFSPDGIGDLQDLHTQAKDDLVSAVNELSDWQTGSTIKDSEIDALFE